MPGGCQVGVAGWRCYITWMKISSLPGRSALVACIILTACAASGPDGAQAGTPSGNTAYGDFLAAHYADAQNDPQTAARYFARALQVDPHNSDFIAGGFMAAELAGSPLALALAPRISGNALAAMTQANAAAIAGDDARAEQFFATLPQDDATGLIKPLLMAWAMVGQGNSQAALTSLTPDFNANGFGSVYALNAALIADAAHDDNDAAQFYTEAAAGPTTLRLAQMLASWLARHGQQDQATAQLAMLAATHPDLEIALPALQAQVSKPVVRTARQGMAEAYLTLAGSLDQTSQSYLQEIFLRFALELRPDLSAARLLLANTLVGGNDPTASPTQAELRDALAVLQPVRPDDALYAPATLQRANLLAALGQPQAAVALLNGLMAQNPTDPDLPGDAGEMLRAAGQCAAAIPYYGKAIALAGSPAPPGAWSLFFDRGICEDTLGNWPAAQADMRQALALSPEQPYVLNYLGYSWTIRGERLGQAKRMLTQAVALDPDDGAVLDSLGVVDLRLHETKTALAVLIQAVEQDPDDAEVNGHLGDAFWQAGDALQAAYQWHRALSFNPDAKLRAALTQKIQLHFGGLH